MQCTTQPNTTFTSGVSCREPTFRQDNLTAWREFRFPVQPCQRPPDRFFISTSYCKVSHETQHLPTPYDLQQTYTCNGLVGCVHSKYYLTKKTSLQHIRTSIHVPSRDDLGQLSLPENFRKSTTSHIQMSSLKRNPPVQPTNQFAECTLAICIIQGVLITAGPLAVERIKSLLHGDRRSRPFRQDSVPLSRPLETSSVVFRCI